MQLQVLLPADSLGCRFLRTSSVTVGNNPKAAAVDPVNNRVYAVNQDDNTVSVIDANQHSTITTLTSTPNPSYYGQPVMMTATVHAQNGSIPIGNVVFQSDGFNIGTVSLDNSGVAVLTYSSFIGGIHDLVAIYQGTTGYQGSTSNTIQQDVDYHVFTIQTGPLRSLWSLVPI